MSEVVRGKALALVVESANITDESGRPVNLDELPRGRTAARRHGRGDGQRRRGSAGGRAGERGR